MVKGERFREGYIEDLMYFFSPAEYLAGKNNDTYSILRSRNNDMSSSQPLGLRYIG